LKFEYDLTEALYNEGTVTDPSKVERSSSSMEKIPIDMKLRKPEATTLKE